MTEEQTGSGYVLAPGAGQTIRFLETLMTVKAGAEETGNAFTLLEWTAPAGFAPPPHTHHAEDEAFFILEGSMVVTCGGTSWEAATGAFVFLPRGVPHGFTVTGETPLRGLQLTVPAGFERFIAEAGEPIESATSPVPTAPDIEKLLTAAAKHHIEIHPMPEGQ
jgi:mannose-6-phosphate isomerase-like protein (cupin superfamily)